MSHDNLKLILNALEINTSEKNLTKIIAAYELVKLKGDAVTIDEIKKLKDDN